MNDAQIEGRVRRIVTVLIGGVVVALVGFNVMETQQQLRAHDVNELGAPLMPPPEIGGILALIGVTIILTEFLRRREGEDS